VTGLPVGSDAVGSDAVGSDAVGSDAVGSDAVGSATNAPIPGMTVGQGPTQAEGQSFFEAVGGHQTFGRIVRSFYDGVAGDPVLGRM